MCNTKYLYQLLVIFQQKRSISPGRTAKSKAQSIDPVLVELKKDTDKTAIAACKEARLSQPRKSLQALAPQVTCKDHTSSNVVRTIHAECSIYIYIEAEGLFSYGLLHNFDETLTHTYS
jgi:hypothetical protein